MCFWKVKDGHLTILTDCSFPSFWSKILESQQQICVRRQNVWKFYKFIIKMERKMVWKWAWKWFSYSIYFGHRGKFQKFRKFRNLRNLMILNQNLNTYGNLDLNVNMLDQLILLVQLPDVSVINTNGNSSLLWCIPQTVFYKLYSTNCKYEYIL